MAKRHTVATPSNPPQQQAARALRKREAEFAFLVAAIRALPKEVREELLRCGSRKEAASWAARRNLNAPCIIAYALALAAAKLDGADRAVFVDGDLRLDLTADSEVPASLGAAIRALDRLRPLPLDVARAVSALNDLPHSATHEALSDRVKTDYLPRYLEQARARGTKSTLANDPLLLAPLCADPLRETLEHFVERANEHYVARRLHLGDVAAAAGLPLGRTRQAPELTKHVDWLIQFQVLGKTWQQIAHAAGADRHAVQVATNRLAKIIGLRRRAVPRGGPRARGNE